MTKAQVKRNTLVSLIGISFFWILPVLEQTKHWFQTDLAPLNLLMECANALFVGLLVFGVIVPVLFETIIRPASKGSLDGLQSQSLRYQARFLEITDWEKR